MAGQLEHWEGQGAQQEGGAGVQRLPGHQVRAAAVVQESHSH